MNRASEYLFVFIIILELNACIYSIEPTEVNCTDLDSALTLSISIKSIIEANCAVSGCHDGSRSPDLVTEKDVIANVSALESVLLNSTMPPDNRDQLTKEELDLVLCWVQYGDMEYIEPASIVDCALSDIDIEVNERKDVDCNGLGSVSVQAIGGSGFYEFSLGGTTYDTISSFDQLDSGLYTILVRDSDSCSASTQVSITKMTALELSLFSTKTDCGLATGSITMQVEGGVEPYLYSLNDGPFQEENTFVNISSGEVLVTAKDGKECMASSNVVVDVNVSLENDIMPIIKTYCALVGCHNGTQSSLMTKEDVIQKAGEIKTRTSERSMPPNRGEKLTNEQIELIACWVDSGSNNN